MSENIPGSFATSAIAIIFASHSRPSPIAAQQLANNALSVQRHAKAGTFRASPRHHGQTLLTSLAGAQVDVIRVAALSQPIRVTLRRNHPLPMILGSAAPSRHQTRDFQTEPDPDFRLLQMYGPRIPTQFSKSPSETPRKTSYPPGVRGSRTSAVRQHCWKTPRRPRFGRSCLSPTAIAEDRPDLRLRMTLGKAPRMHRASGSR